ncbi:BREX-1 system adenine-specific DNA-methyltransferase PglX [Eubacteriaceae bacterium ES2]|nr:BREX-1 system adenine-specific DNA-methyltransferase PglX [Eubacteriaceae bacterium ES2]
MNKTAIKNFAIWARNKLIADITYKAGLLGISGKEIKEPLPQSTPTVQFFDIGTKEPYSISGKQIKQRQELVKLLKENEQEDAFNKLVEEVAYTWFNRLIAIRFMEVNDYLPTRIRVLSSEKEGKSEPDLVTSPFDADLGYSDQEKDQIIALKKNNQWDKLFRMLFIKQCNALNEILPELFEKTNDYSELLLNLSYTDSDGVVAHLVNDIAEVDFNVEKEGQVEIIGWLYQYYNTEPKDEVFALLKKNVKITKERIPAATQLFTPDWIVRYMVENSLGRLWLEHCQAESGLSSEVMNASYYGWKYYLEEADQEAEVEKQLAAIRQSYKDLRPQDIKLIDPCMGSGHILVYAFDVLMAIYESQGYSQRDAAVSILENNLYGLDIDKRAYQLSYFALMMKARHYNRRIFTNGIKPHIYAIDESNGITTAPIHDMGINLSEEEYDLAVKQAVQLVEEFHDAKEYGSILNITPCDWDLLRRFAVPRERNGQMTFDMHGEEEASVRLQKLIDIGEAMAQKYHVVVTNPPYMGSKGMSAKLTDFVKKNYPDSKSDLFAVFMESCGQMTNKNGFQAMITQHAWMFLSSFEKLRTKLMERNLVNMAHLGPRAFEEIGGEVVQTTAFVMENNQLKDYQGSYARLIDYGSQNAKEEAFLAGNDLYIAKQENFSKIPGMPIAYWVSDCALKAYDDGILLKEILMLKAGLSTADNPRYQRLWTEVNLKSIGFEYRKLEETKDGKHKWFPCHSGGEYRKWSTNNEYVIDWQFDGKRLKKQKGAALRNKDFYFQEGLTWNKLSSSNFGVKHKSNGFIFDDTSRSAFLENSDFSLRYILGFLCSKVAFMFLQALNPTMSFTNNDLERLPLILNVNQNNVDSIVNTNICISQNDWDFFETSWDFKTHPLVDLKSDANVGIICSYEQNEKGNLVDTETSFKSGCLKEAFERWQDFTAMQFTQLKANEEELNRIFIDIYGLGDELTPEVEDKDVTIRKADLSREIRSFISYAVGCMFGRYSLDVQGLAYAGGEWDNQKYKTFIPDKDNVLPITDEEYFEDDIVGLFVTFVQKVYGKESLEDNLDFIAAALGNKGNTSREIIRNYFLKDFYKDHCKIYQKRPIYWLFDSGKENGFKALIYLHRYNADTIGNLRVDYLHRMQKVYESEMNRMQETIENSSNSRDVSAATKRKEKLIKQLKESKDYDEKIAHLALARIELDLDDGVKVNYEKVQTDVNGNKIQVLGKI